MNKSWFAVLVGVALCVSARVEAENAWSKRDYEHYAGDFDGDGLSDLLYVARKPGKLSGVALFDGAGFNLSLQSWGNAYLGIPWSSGQYRILVADFNGDGKDDLLLQRNAPGDHYLLLAEDGGFMAIHQTIPQRAAGLTWSADRHVLVAGDYNGDARSDLYFQPVSAKELSAIVFADENGQFTSSKPAQSWRDGYAGFRWSRADSLIFSGDFDANGLDDLLIQARPLHDTNPQFGMRAEFAPNSNGVVLAQAASKLFIAEQLQAWSEDGFEAEWSPASNKVTIGDFNGDAHSDVLLQGRTDFDSSYLLYGKAPGEIFQKAELLNEGAVPSAKRVHVFVGRFLAATTDALFFQAFDPSQGNSLQRVNGASVDALAVEAAPAVPSEATAPAQEMAKLPGSGGAEALLAVTAVGRTPGRFNVTPFGAATYQIPIWTPAGARGIDPNLSLVYVSGGPDGPLGPSWSLSGLSMLARCGKTYASSAGSPAAIKLTTADDICLDGNRLRKTSGTQLVAGSTYQTEIEVFSRVTAHGTAGSGPSYFIVEGKDGLFYEYGNSADSKAFTDEDSTTPFAWMLNKVSDRQGNNMTVTYSNSNGDVQPTTIAYTRTAAMTGPTPYIVNFIYQTRVTSLKKYVAGGGIQQTKVLSKIDVRSATTSVRQYNLSYVTAPTTKRDRLQSVQECGGSAGTDCLRATTISYQNGSAGVTSTLTSTGSGSTVATTMKSADFNGDGRFDLLYATGSSSYTWWVQLASSTGYGSRINTGLTTTAPHNFLIDDFDGNGSDDLLGVVSGTWRVYRWNGTAFASASTGAAVDPAMVASANGVASADYNGDGLSDLVWLSEQGFLEVTVRRNTSTGGAVSFAAPAATSVTIANFTNPRLMGGNGYANTAVRHMDFNGDGREDLIASTNVPRVGAVVQQLMWNGTTFSVAAIGGNSATSWLPVRWNEDACTDLVYAPGAGNGDAVHLSKCDGAPVGAATMTLPAGATLSLDWDGDGRTDILKATGGVWQVYRSLSAAIALPTSTGIAVGSGGWIVTEQNGDGLSDLLFANSAASNAISYGLHNGSSTPPDLATRIADGWGISAEPEYVPITQSNYTKHATATFPYSDFIGPLYVVSRTEQSDGIGGIYTDTFSYFGAQFHRQGLGFMGFDRTRSQDSRNGLRNDTYYRRDFPYTGRVRRQDLLQTDGSVISRTVNDFDVIVLSGADCNTATSRCFPFVSKETVTTREITAGSPLVQTAVTDFVYDTYGNPTSVSTTKTDNDPASPFFNSSWTSTVTNVFTNNVASWCIGRPTETRTQNTAPGQPTVTRRVDHGVNAANCRFTTETIEPASATLKVITTFGYDTCGNTNSTSVVGHNQSGTALPARVTTSNFGTRCQLAESTTNPLNETTTIAYNYANGMKSSMTDPNGTQVNWLYDNFARRTRESRPDSTYTTWAYADCISATCWGEPNLRMRVTQTEFSSASTEIGSREQHSDGFDRPRFDASDRVLGVWTTMQTRYDNLGRKQDVYQPYSTGTNGHHHFDYDLLNRPITDTWFHANGTVDRTTSIAYAGLKTTLTDAKGNATQKWTDVTGLLRKIIDPSPGGTTDYVYDAFGNLKQVTDPTLVPTSYGYNIRGFKTSTVDPDTSSSTFMPNSLNELVSQTDAKGQVTSFTYDKLGRMLTRLEPESATPTTWVYGSNAALNEIGRLKSVSKPDGYAETYTYDSIGRPASVTYTEDTAYQVNYTYNSIGKLDVVTYPASTSGYRFALKHLYSFGFLHQVKDNASSTTYWTLNSANDYSSPLAEVLGNGVTVTSSYVALTNELNTRKVGSGGTPNSLQDLTFRWDDNGNLDRRQDLAQGLTEVFTYDGLNRLETSKLNNVLTLNVDYDTAGNITNKNDVGGYDYSTDQAGCDYTGLPDQPHAVRNAGGAVYCYDENGNMTKRGGSNITWYSYNQPNSIASGSNSTQFNYNANHQRWRQVAVEGGATTTTFYVGGILEKVVRPGGVTEYRHLIPTGSGRAIYTRRSDVTNSTYYMTTDHLGSGDLVLSSAGAVLARESFTPFGERRGSNWQGLPSAGDRTVFSDVSRRGFTGHEMLDAVGLVNMNGRVYDPRIGRFLSADPVVQTITLSQALNPYSYVMNNPLTLTDPTGYSWLSKLFSSIGKFFKKFWRPILAIVATVVTFGYLAPLASQWFFASAYSCLVPGAITAAGATFAGAIVGAVAGGIMGGVRGALAGLITGGILGWTGAVYGNCWTLGRVATEGVASGVGSEISGGSFADGFRLAAGFGLLRWGAFKMREAMVAQSCSGVENPNCTGTSNGAFGDRTKMAGGRVNWRDKLYDKPSPLGGNQSGGGEIFGISYDAGGFFDGMLESYAGPHDWFSSFRYGYDGSLVPYTKLGEALFGIYSAAAIVPATPFAFATAVPTSAFVPSTFGDGDD